MDRSTFETVSRLIDSYQDEIIAVQTHLTAIPALAPENGGEGEARKSEYIQSYLENTLKCDQIDSYPAPDDRVPSGFRPNLIGRIKGRSQAKTIWIMSHMDVVPPGDLSKWDGDPWKVRVQDGKIYGRGAEDNQQGIVSSFMAVKAFREAGVMPAYDIGLILVADEETGSKYGIQHVLKKHKDLFKPEDLIIIPDSGNSEGGVVEIAEKSIIWIKFKTTGKQTHASTPGKGVNAHKAGAHLIVKLNNLYVMYNASDPVFDPPTSTFEPTKKDPNVPNINTVPGEDIFYYDCRILPNYDVDQFWVNVKRICKEIEGRYGVTIEATSEQEMRAAPPTPANAPVVKALEKAIGEVRGIQPKSQGIGGGTVAAYFREAGFNAAVWATQDESLHEPNEYVQIVNIMNDAKVFAHVALQT